LFSAEIENRFLHFKEWEKISFWQRLWRDFFIAKIKKRFSLLQKLSRDLIIAESEKRFLHCRDCGKISSLKRLWRD
jgi:hypothetical protein